MGFGQPSGGNNSFKPTPPARGSFPLDHDAECKEFMMNYLNCVKKNSLSTELCREYSINYLKCRMERNLMAEDDLLNLGFTKEEIEKAPKLKN